MLPIILGNVFLNHLKLLEKKRVGLLQIKKLTLNEKKVILKMYNSVIECVKVSNMCIGLKKDLFGLV